MTLRLLGGGGGAGAATSSQLEDPLGNTPKAAQLLPFHAALANRASAPVNLMFLGDSITEGNGTTSYRNRWQDKLADAYRHRFFVSGSPGVAGPTYVPVFFASPLIAASNPWTIANAPVTAANFGIGARYARLTAANQTCTITVYGTSMVLLWAPGSVGVHGSYTVDGGSATTFLADTTVGTADGQTTTITLGAYPATHTVVVAWSSGGTFNFEGAVVHNGTESAGLRFWDWAHSGFATDTFANGNGAASLTAIVPYIKPHLVVINMGANDWNTNVSVATFQANLTSIISNIRSAMTGASLALPSIVLTVGYPSAGSGTTPWAQYQAAIKAIATADPTIALWDLSLHLPGTPDSWGLLYSDATHPSTEGHQFYATALGDWLAPGVDAPRVHGSTHAPGQSDDSLLFSAWQNAASIETAPRIMCPGTVSTAVGFEYLFNFIPSSTLTIGNLTVLVRTGAGSGTTLARLGLFTVDASGNYTLVARTASSTTFFTTTGAVATGALATAGSFPATYTLQAGVLYAIGILSVGSASAPTFVGAALAHALGAALAPALAVNSTSTQTDLVSLTSGNVTSQGSLIYARLN